MNEVNEEKVYIFDTTLRDGEQCPGASMTIEEKICIAEILDEMKVDIVEAGFPVASKGDFEAVREISKRARYSTICGLSRAIVDDIERAAEALEPARNKRIHTFIATSPLHMKHKLQKSPEEVKEAIRVSVRRARELCDDVEWSCEDGTRSDIDFLKQCFEIAIGEGAATVNIADTVGYILPHEFELIVLRLRDEVPGIDKVRFSVHCHNDLGLGVANSLAAIRAGARQVECTINGIGERAGNASLEEIVMAIRTRGDQFGVRTGISSELLTSASRALSSITGFPVPPNKAIVGANAFAHESGIHQHGVIKHSGTYEIMTPASVGARGSRIVFGKHSGRNAFRQKLDDLGYTLSNNAFEEAFLQMKEFGDSRKTIEDDDIRRIVKKIIQIRKNRFRLANMELKREPNGSYQVGVEIEEGDRIIKGNAADDTPFEAIAKAIKEALPYDADITYYKIHTKSENHKQEAKVTVRMESGDHSYVGQGVHEDNHMAFGEAYLQVYNKALDNPNPKELSSDA